jgi:hypothetical protein
VEHHAPLPLISAWHAGPRGTPWRTWENAAKAYFGWDLEILQSPVNGFWRSNVKFVALLAPEPDEPAGVAAGFAAPAQAHCGGFVPMGGAIFAANRPSGRLLGVWAFPGRKAIRRTMASAILKRRTVGRNDE